MNNFDGPPLGMMFYVEDLSWDLFIICVNIDLPQFDVR